MPSYTPAPPVLRPCVFPLTRLSPPLFPDSSQCSHLSYPTPPGSTPNPSTSLAGSEKQRRHFYHRTPVHSQRRPSGEWAEEAGLGLGNSKHTASLILSGCGGRAGDGPLAYPSPELALLSFLAGHLERALGFHRGIGRSHRNSDLLPGLQRQEPHPGLRAVPSAPRASFNKQLEAPHLRRCTLPSTQIRAGQPASPGPHDNAALSGDWAETPVSWVCFALWYCRLAFPSPPAKPSLPGAPVTSIYLLSPGCLHGFAPPPSTCGLAEDCLVLSCPSVPPACPG